MRLLVTRPAPDDERTAHALRAYGHEVLVAPVLRMEALDCSIPEQAFAGIVMTSANAARAIAAKAQLARLACVPVFTVGPHTRQAAQAVGFRNVRCADGDRQDLLRLIMQELDASSGPLLYLAGDDRAGDIELPRLAVITAVVYRMRKVERFPAAIETALAQSRIEGVLHFSRRSAQAFVECAQRGNLLGRARESLHFCLSSQVAQPLATIDCGSIKIAARPHEAALIELVNRGS